jgi:phenylacetate-CoA ligase
LPGLKSVITTSEVLDDHSRSLIERVFGVKVFNEYGCGEVGSIGHECEHGNMHIMAENVIIEIDTRNSADGESGEIIVTDLYNYAMPLIRYRLGDYATLSKENCECGRGLPVIKRVHGRAYDMIVDPDGNRFHPEVLMYIFEEFKSRGAGIAQFQVIQTRVDSFLISIVPDKFYKKETEADIVNRIRERIHPGFSADFRYVNEVMREKSGKLRVIKSELNPY